MPVGKFPGPQLAEKTERRRAGELTLNRNKVYGCNLDSRVRKIKKLEIALVQARLPTAQLGAHAKPNGSPSPDQLVGGEGVPKIHLGNHDLNTENRVCGTSRRANGAPE